MQILVILYYIYQLSIHSVHCTTNTAYLTTSSPSNNGASVSVLKDTSTSGGKWNIKATDQIGFHVKLTMNSLYAFHATEPSTFTIKIGSDTVTGGNDKDFIASFSQSSSRYVSFEMSIDDAYGNVMYPTCDTTSSYHAFQSGNVKALCDATSGSREAKAVGGSGNYGYFGPRPASTAYPLTWTFVNYPGSHTEMTYSCPGTTATTCGFSPPFASDVPLEVFFATEDDGEEFAITYIDISLTWEPTPNPTSNPTSTPTPKPTPKPTTRDPTTASPTANPSRDPTVTPSRNPTTRDPSINPTKTPTKGPTTTQRDRDGEVVEEPSTTEDEDNQDDEPKRDDKDQGQQRENLMNIPDWALPAMVVILTLICCLVCVGCVLLKKLRKYANNQEAIQGVMCRVMRADTAQTGSISNDGEGSDNEATVPDVLGGEGAEAKTDVQKELPPFPEEMLMNHNLQPQVIVVNRMVPVPVGVVGFGNPSFPARPQVNPDIAAGGTHGDMAQTGVCGDCRAIKSGKIDED
eukprot:32926_1